MHIFIEDCVWLVLYSGSSCIWINTVFTAPNRFTQEGLESSDALIVCP